MREINIDDDRDLVAPEQQPGEAWPLAITFASVEISFPEHPGAVMTRRVSAPPEGLWRCRARGRCLSSRPRAEIRGTVRVCRP